MPCPRSRPATLLATLLVTLLVTACATFVPEPAGTAPDAPRATFSCYWREYLLVSRECQVQAVSGSRPTLWHSGAHTASVPAGRQWVEIAFQSFGLGGGGTTDVCAFDFDFLPDAHYRVRPHSESFGVSWLARQAPGVTSYPGTLVMERLDGQGPHPAQVVATTCSHGGGSFCRRQEDCVDHPDMRCERAEGQAFGRCTTRAPAHPAPGP